MNIFFFPIFITLTITIIAAYFDLKKGIIPNKLTLFLFVFGIAINSFFSIFYNDSNYVLSSIILASFTFLLCYILWKIKLWAGGDVKLLTAIVASMFYSPNIFKFQFFDMQFPLIAIYPFPLTLIFNSILISFPFLIIFLIFNNYKNYLKSNKFKYKKIMNLYNLISRIKTNLVKYNEIMNFNNIKYRFNNNKNLIFKKILFSLFFSSLLLIFTGIYSNIYYSFYFLLFSVIFSFISSFLFKLFKNFKNFIKNASNKEIAIFNLSEGMIIHNIDLIIDKKHNKTFKKIRDKLDFDKSNINIKQIKSSKSSEKELKYILSLSTAAGLTIQDISFIKKLFKLGFIHETTSIKIGVPFAPSIAIALIIAIFFGDLSVLIVNILNNILNCLQII
ncbi:MAG: A24 family peptidase [Methanobacteriaceae archaeon]|jgi:preflagellin peptidase FlaK|nr:A24 family peptidase [Candidatus Methanorudis spinitermitis]